MKARKLIGSAVAVLFALAPLTLSAAEESVARTKGSAKDTVHRASEIVGMTVKNEANKDLGEVDDIVVDVTSGEVHYLAVSYGGFLGLGDKQFAVPVDVFQVRQGDEEDEYYLVLPVDEQTLKNAPGFNQDNWPNFADKSWSDKVNKHYGKYRRSKRDRRGADISIRAGNTEASVDIDTNRERDRVDNRIAERDSSTRLKDTIHRTSDITGMTVKNDKNKDLGEVNDVVIDLDRGNVKYLALSYGGFLGVGDKLFAVPFDAFDCRQADQEDEYFLTVNVDEQTLKNAPGFDQDEWPNFAESRWDDEINRHYRSKNRRAQGNRAGRVER